MNYKQNESIKLTNAYGFRIWENEDRNRFSASFVRVDDDLDWPVNAVYNLTQEDLFRMYVFIGGMLNDEYVKKAVEDD